MYVEPALAWRERERESLFGARLTFRPTVPGESGDPCLQPGPSGTPAPARLIDTNHRLDNGNRWTSVKHFLLFPENKKYVKITIF